MEHHRNFLNREEICIRAGEILAQLDRKRGLDEGAAFLFSWTAMWELMQEARLAGFTFRSGNSRSWIYVEAVEDLAVKRRRLTSGEFEIPVPTPHDAQLAADLPDFLNWACVPQPKRG